MEQLPKKLVFGFVHVADRRAPCGRHVSRRRSNPASSQADTVSLQHVFSRTFQGILCYSYNTCKVLFLLKLDRTSDLCIGKLVQASYCHTKRCQLSRLVSYAALHVSRRSQYQAGRYCQFFESRRGSTNKRINHGIR